MGVTFFISIAAIAALVAALFIPAVRVAIEQVLFFIREGFKWFYQTAPRPVVLLIFLFIVLFMANTIIGGFLYMQYDCLGGELREIKGGIFGGIGYLIQGAWLSITGTTSSCMGTPSQLCGTFSSNNDTCNQIGCFSSGGVCAGSINSCDYFSGNATLCGLVGCDNSTAQGTLNDFIANNTNPAVQYMNDTPENLLQPSCVSDKPRLTLRGFDFLAYRNIFILMMIGGLIWLIVAFRKLQSGR